MGWSYFLGAGCLIAPSEVELREQALSADSTADLMFTSGTTGRPKGVMVEHAGIVSYLSGMQDDFPLRPGDSFLQATPLTFDVSVYEIFWPLWQGATVVLVPGTSRVDMEHVGTLMRRHRVTGFHFVPSLLDLFVSEVDPADCAALRYAFCSGEGSARNRISAFISDLKAIATSLLIWKAAAITPTIFVPPSSTGAATTLYSLPPESQIP